MTGFQPTLPARGATSKILFYGQVFDISTHAPRTGSDSCFRASSNDNPISTHAPRTGSDQQSALAHKSRCYFNPRSPHGERLGGLDCFHLLLGISTHAPRTGSDAKQYSSTLGAMLFQPTLPARGATSRTRRRYWKTQNFNPRSPHGERLTYQPETRWQMDFNPRSPHGERHNAYALSRVDGRDFNPRSPHGERPNFTTLVISGVMISTHAPRTGSD